MVTFRTLVAGGPTWIASIGYKTIAQFGTCPRGWYVQWHHLQHGDPGHCEFVATEAEARRLVEEWARGLEIIPWDE